MDTQQVLAVLEEFIADNASDDSAMSVRHALEALELLRDTISYYEMANVAESGPMTYCTDCGDSVELEYADMCDRCRAVLCRVCFIEHPTDCKMDFMKGER